VLAVRREAARSSTVQSSMRELTMGLEGREEGKLGVNPSYAGTSMCLGIAGETSMFRPGERERYE
jgi:hypothetical protein